VRGCDKEESSVFGFEGMGVNAKALTSVKCKHLTSENTKALNLGNHRTDIMCLFFYSLFGGVYPLKICA